MTGAALAATNRRQSDANETAQWEWRGGKGHQGQGQRPKPGRTSNESKDKLGAEGPIWVRDRELCHILLLKGVVKIEDKNSVLENFLLAE